MRIGHGYDVHKLVPGRDLILGGVRLEHERGLLGHSDADVLTHAVMDALLGAAARVRAAGFRVGNVDATIIAQKPKLAGAIGEMRTKLAGAMGVDAGQVNVKATTEERLGFTGREEGIAAHAVALIEEDQTGVPL